MSESQDNWFSTGQTAIDKAMIKRSVKGTGRFFLKNGGEAVIAFIDGDNSEAEPIINYREHQYDRLDGSWSNYCSCVGLPECVFCQKKIKPYDAWPFSIIQMTPVDKWTDRDGKEQINHRKMLVCKQEAMQKAIRCIKQRAGLGNCIFTIFRSSARASTVGDIWDFQEKVPGGREGLAAKLGLPLDIVQPVNYREFLRPKSPEEIAAEMVDWAKTAQGFNEKSKGAAPAAAGAAAPAAGATGTADASKAARVNF